MTVNSRGDVSAYAYLDDAGNNWSVHLTSEVANAGSFVALTGNEANFRGKWPESQKKLRHIGIKRTQGAGEPNPGKVMHDRVPIANPATNNNYKLTSLAVNGFNGHNWTVTGRIGEKLKV